MDLSRGDPERSPHDVMALHPASLGVTTLELEGGHSLRLCQEMGRGGFGVVYAGRSSKVPGGPVAVKMVEHSGDGEATEAVAREVDIHTRLFASPDHAATRLLVRLHEHVAQPFRSLLILEFCHGIELEDFMQQQPSSRLSEALARPAAAQLAEALAYMHDVAGVAHLDVMPANVLVTPASPRQPSGTGISALKLIDYGSAAPLEGGGDGWVDEHGGTPNYRAPERHDAAASRGARFRGAAADVYAFGATLFHMVCGAPPFDWEDEQDEEAHAEHLRAIRAGAVPFPKSAGTAPTAPLSPALRRLIQSTLAFEPTSRPPMAQVLAALTRGTGDGEETEAATATSEAAEAMGRLALQQQDGGEQEAALS